jgi:hypothetical protein
VANDHDLVVESSENRWLKIMNRIVVEKRLNGEGILQLTLPMGSLEAGRDVRVTVEPVLSRTDRSLEDWHAWVDSMAGSWQGDFERASQGEYEKREPLS